MFVCRWGDAHSMPVSTSPLSRPPPSLPPPWLPTSSSSWQSSPSTTTTSWQASPLNNPSPQSAGPEMGSHFTFGHHTAGANAQYLQICATKIVVQECSRHLLVSLLSCHPGLLQGLQGFQIDKEHNLANLLLLPNPLSQNSLLSFCIVLTPHTTVSQLQ